jgi:hypothetical protein
MEDFVSFFDHFDIAVLIALISTDSNREIFTSRNNRNVVTYEVLKYICAGSALLFH